MIAHLTGTLRHKSPVHIVVDVQGVGYQVFVPLSTFYALPETGETIAVNVHTHLRDDALKLFGFLTLEEQMVFEKLIGISKVGPKLALAILSGMPPQELMTAIMEHDVARIATIPGVGKKTAERLALEMKDKLADVALEFSPQAPATASNGVLDDALSALINLGYKKPEAEKALKSIWEKNERESSLQDLIKDSLSVLS